MITRGRLNKAIKKSSQLRTEMREVKSFSDQWNARLAINKRKLKVWLAAVQGEKRRIWVDEL